MVFYIYRRYPQFYNELEEYEKKFLSTKYWRSWNFHPKPYLAIYFWVLFLMIRFEDVILIFYIWPLNTTIEGTMKKYSISITFSYYF